MNEILNNHFKKEEHPKVVEEIEKDDSFKEIYDRIKDNPNFRMSVLEERIEKTEETFILRFEAFKEAVLDAEKNLLSEEQITNSLTDIIKENKEGALSKLREKADKKVPFVGAALFDMANDLMTPSLEEEEESFFGKFFSRIKNSIGKSIGKSIMVLLGLWGGYEGLTNGNNKNGNSLEDNTSQEDETTPVVEKGDESSVEEENFLSDEKKSAIYFRAGINTLISFSGLEYEKNDYKIDIINSIHDLSHDELVALKSNESEQEEFLEGKGLKLSDTNKDVFNKIINSICSQNSIILLNNGLKEENVKNIIKPDGENISQRLKKLVGKGDEEKGENKLLEIFKNLDGNFDWKKDLTINEIGIFYLELYPVSGIVGYKELINKGDKLFTGLQNSISIENINGMGAVLESKSEEILPKAIVTNFLQIAGTNLSFGGDEYMGMSFEELVTKFDNPQLESDEQEKLKELVDFKEFLLNGFINEKTLMLKGSEGLFTDHLNYKYVIALYSVMGGKKSLENVSLGNYPIIYSIVADIIGDSIGGDTSKAKATEYLSNVGQEVLLSNTEEVFTDEQKQVLGVYFKKMINVVGAGIINDFYKKIGILNALNDDYLLSIGLFAGGTVLSHLGRKDVTNSKSGKKGNTNKAKGALKKFGLIFKLGALITTVSKFSMNNLNEDFLNDIQEHADDPEKIIDILKKHKDNTKEIPLSNGEKAILVGSYESDHPYVVYEGKIWMFGVGPKIESIDAVVGTAAEIIGSEIEIVNNGRIEGIEIDMSVWKVEGEKLVFGKGNNTKEFNFDDVKTGIIGEQFDFDNILKDAQQFLVSEINQTIEGIGADGRIGKMKESKDLKYIMIKDINSPGKGDDLILFEVGEIDNK